jgi:peptide/nickel transport system ATP-binding protein
MTAPGLDIRDLVIRNRSGKALVGPISFAVARGTALTIIGETGSGKSLIAQALMGLLPPELAADGTLKIANALPVDLGKPDAVQRFWGSRTLLLPQEPHAALDPTMRVGRQLALRHGSGARAQVALAAVDLPSEAANLYPFALSGGMAQRALVAMASMSDADIAIADEPTKGLDAPRVAQVGDLLARLLAQGRTLVVVTHEIAVARRLAGDVLVLRDGAIVEYGPTAHVLGTPQNAYTRAWIAADPGTWSPCQRCHADDGLVLAAHGLAAEYRTGQPLFSDLDLHVPAGGVVAIAGPSGCGKSTLGNVLLGLKTPTSGAVSWAGIDPYRDAPARTRFRRRYQKLHQDPLSVFVPNRTVGQHLADLAEVLPEPPRADRTAELLERLKLPTALLERAPSELSGGEGQRFALLRLLLMRPRLIVADEPTSRLDPLVQKQTIKLLRSFVDQEGLAVVLIGHDRRLLAATADEIVEL